MKKLLILIFLFLTGFGIEKVNAQTNNAFGDNQVQVEPGVFAIYTGDITQDGFIDLFDQIQQDNDLFNGLSGYYPTDLNGDGFIDLFDQIYLDNNLFIGVGAVTPI